MGIKLSVNGLCVNHLDSRMMLEVSINGEVKRGIKEEMSEMGRGLRWAVNIRFFFQNCYTIFQIILSWVDMMF